MLLLIYAKKVLAMFDWRRAGRSLLPPNVRWRLSHARLHYWGGANFGDELSPFLVERLFGVRTIRVEPEAADLFCVGSILGDLDGQRADYRRHIWGSGFMFPGDDWVGDREVFHAVRGHLSLARVQGVASGPIALGDPGLLTPLVLPVPQDSAGPISVVPHFYDFDGPVVSEIRESYPDVQIIDVRSGVTAVVRRIASSRLVLSSSLHGLVVADAYNVPNVWTPMSGKVEGGAYKFDDYYSVFGLKSQPFDPLEVLNDGQSFIRDWEPKPALSAIQESLLRSFPGPPRKG